MFFSDGFQCWSLIGLLIEGLMSIFYEVVVDVDLVYLYKDDLDDVEWALGVDDPKTLDIHLGSKSQDILPDDVVL